MNFADQNNLPVVATSGPNNTTAKFFIKLTSSDTVAAGAVGKFAWLIVPALSAGGADPVGQLYFVGAKLSYTLNGVATNIDVSPASIRVLPMPQLSLDYFLPYVVYGDDPTTSQIEAPIPFSLGVRVKNTGYGNAEQLKIESSQPKIIDNQQGSAVSFQIIGSEVNGNMVTPSLLVITLTDLNAAPKSEVFIVDARPRLFFQRGHIPGAINIAKQYLARGLPNAEAVLNQSRGKRVVVHCAADDCDDSLFVARELLRSGMSRVYVFKGGWQESKTDGLQEERG